MKLAIQAERHPAAVQIDLGAEAFGHIPVTVRLEDDGNDIAVRMRVMNTSAPKASDHPHTLPGRALIKDMQ